MKKLFTKSEELQGLDDEIKFLVLELRDTSSTDEDYAHLLDALERLIDLRNKHTRKILSKENAPLIANLVGIAMILYHEKAEVITSKALGFVTKGRV